MTNEIKTLTPQGTFFVGEIRRSPGRKTKVMMVSFVVCPEPLRLTFPVSDEAVKLINIGDRYVLTMVKEDWVKK